MIDFSQPYSVDWRVYRVDEGTWDEMSEVSGIVSASVDRDCTDQVPLLETSTITFDAPIGERFRSGYYRIIAYIRQSGQYVRMPVTTQLYQITSFVSDPGVIRSSQFKYHQVTIDGQSVLLPAAEIRMRDGSYVAKNTNGAQWVVGQLRSILKAPVYLDGSGFQLKRHIVYDSNDTVLSAVWSVLDAGKWCLMIDGTGTVRVTARPKEPTFTLNEDSTKFFHPELKIGDSKKGVYNRYIVRYGLNEYVAVNDDPNSETSTVSVGRYVDAPIDTNPYLLVGESPQEYARRKLEEASTVSSSYDYTREYMPDIYPMCIVRAVMPNMGVDGDLRIAKQKLTLDQGITVSETALLDHKYWKAR